MMRPHHAEHAATVVLSGLVTEVQLRTDRIARVTMRVRQKSVDVVGSWPWHPHALHPHATSLRIRASAGRQRFLTLRQVLHCSTPPGRMEALTAALDQRHPSPELTEAVDQVALQAEPCFAWTWESRLSSSTWQRLLPQVRERPWSFWHVYGAHPQACLTFSACRALSAKGDPALAAAQQVQQVETCCAQLKSTCIVSPAVPLGTASPDLVEGRLRRVGGVLYPRRLYDLERRVERLCRGMGSSLVVSAASAPPGGEWRAVVTPTLPSAQRLRCGTLPLRRQGGAAAAVLVRDAHLLGLEQAEELLAAVARNRGTLALHGDPHQLPPLGTGALFRNLLGVTESPVFVPACPAERIASTASVESWVRQRWRRSDELLVCSTSRWCALFNGEGPPRSGDRVVCVSNVTGGPADGTVGTLREGLTLETPDGQTHTLPSLDVVQRGWAVTVRRIQGADLSRWPRLVVASADMSRRALRTAVLGGGRRCRVMHQCEWDEYADQDTVRGENRSTVSAHQQD